MPKVDWYERIGGKSLEEAVAYHQDVVNALDYVARVMQSRATADLANKAKHPYSEGKSYVTTQHGRLDAYVVLHDPDEDSAPWAIEKGTYRSRGIHVLLDSARGMIL